MLEKKNLVKFVTQFLSGLKKNEIKMLKLRFGLLGEKRNTLESIGKNFGITRERVRQIVEKAMGKLKKEFLLYPAFIKELRDLLKERGVMSEKRVIEEFLNEGLFFFYLHPEFLREKEDQDYYTFWTLKRNREWVRRKVESVIKLFEKEKRLFSLREIASSLKIDEKKAREILEISKKIGKNEEGFYGLKEWPEITPKGIKDLAYIVLKKTQRPLHFTEIASLIKNANVNSVHNELLRNERFVLVGRGIFALREWGYFPGTVKEVILKIFQEEKRPLAKEEILEKVKEQRIVKPATVFLALSDKKYFQKNSEGKYTIKPAQI